MAERGKSRRKCEFHDKQLELNGSGSANMVVNDLQVDKLECSINGSGTINLKKGNAKEGEYSITSSGEIMAFGVDVPELSCKMTGNGTMEVHPTAKVKSFIKARQPFNRKLLVKDP